MPQSKKNVGSHFLKGYHNQDHTNDRQHQTAGEENPQHDFDSGENFELAFRFFIYDDVLIKTTSLSSNILESLNWILDLLPHTKA